MISVIIPVFNQVELLKKTLESFLTQTFKNFEVIVVDDFSRDGSFVATTKYEDKFKKHFIALKVMRHQENLGAPAARNTGFRASRGEYLFFCDADAHLIPEALETLYNKLNSRPEASFAYSSFKFGKKLFRLFPFDPERLKKMPYIHTMALIRRKDFPGFDESLKKFQDWDLFLRMAEAGKSGVWVDKVLFQVKPGGTMSSWLPSITYKLLPFLPAVKKYKRGMEIIRKKHSAFMSIEK